jgi:DivIVA domain-containing protein
MIDLTPLDVRKKRGDFGKALRGYDPQEVDGFLELVAERMEVLVKENLRFREEIDQLGQKVVVQEGREQAVQDALVTAQELRRDVKEQAHREAKLLEREAQGRVEIMIAESEKLLTEHHSALQELERQRERFLKAFRTLLERELDTVEVEFGRAPLEDVTLDLELGHGRWSIGEDEDDAGDGDDRDDGKDDGRDDGRDDDKDDDQDQQDAASKNQQHEKQAKGRAPATGSAKPKAKQRATKVDDQRPPEGKEGDDSLWLSSIMTDRKDKGTE